MTDLASLRNRRHRAHKAGNHALCRPEFCDNAPARAATGSVSATVESYLAARDLSDGPKAIAAELARQVARQLDIRITAALVRELRALLGVLASDDADAWVPMRSASCATSGS